MIQKNLEHFILAHFSHTRNNDAMYSVYPPLPLLVVQQDIQCFYVVNEANNFTIGNSIKLDQFKYRISC